MCKTKQIFEANKSKGFLNSSVAVAQLHWKKIEAQQKKTKKIRKHVFNDINNNNSIKQIKTLYSCILYTMYNVPLIFVIVG